ncbi:hypothetical protein [Streptomyces himalayensis]|uniref:hypothetical protein n=1 Tax=Streptomyces himalayensis TaxID=2820085 RepID=UPI00403EC987
MVARPYDAGRHGDVVPEVVVVAEGTADTGPVARESWEPVAAQPVAREPWEPVAAEPGEPIPRESAEAVVLVVAAEAGTVGAEAVSVTTKAVIAEPVAIKAVVAIATETIAVAVAIATRATAIAVAVATRAIAVTVAVATRAIATDAVAGAVAVVRFVPGHSRRCSEPERDDRGG